MRTSSLGVGGSLYGITPPPLIAGKFVLPDGFVRGYGLTLTLTAGRYYYAWKYIDRIETFSGVQFRDNGSGNNGMKVKIAAFALNSSTGALSGVAKNFGEVTLDGTAGIETLSSAWTPAYVGWHVLGLVSDSAASLYAMGRGFRQSDAGDRPPDLYGSKLGTFSAAFFAQIAASNTTNTHGDYVAGTYANFPEASPLAPTASIYDVGNAFPLFGLLK